MIQAKCIQKFRDKTGKIYGYRLIDLNGQTQDLTSDNLKAAIRNKQINVVNLTLTSDNRLVDTTEKQVQSKPIDKAKLYTLGKDVLTAITGHLFDVNINDIIYDATSFVLRHDNSCFFIKNTVKVFDYSHIVCTLQISLPDFNIIELEIRDMDSRSNEHHFTIGEIKGLCLLSQKNEILNCLDSIKKKYKKDIKLVKDEASMLGRFTSKIFNSSDNNDKKDNITLKDFCEWRLKNDSYLGTIGSRGFQRANDKFVVEHMRK